MPNFQNNFATNLTSNTGAGATTSPINSIPTVDAPYYIAFDATNLNSHYEVVHVTSDTTTNVNHAATAYDHTTAEEVRLVLPAVHLNTMQNFPEGFLINGKISPTVASNNLTVAIKTLAGADPSVTDPVYCRMGDTVRSITAALSVTVNAGANSFNAGSAELATKEIDYFVGLMWRNSSVAIGFSRHTNHASLNSTATSENYLAASAAFTAVDYYTVIGRFAATLSAGAGYTWTVPTFTEYNLIQRPIYETRWLNWVPTISVSGGTAPTYTNIFINRYKIQNDRALCNSSWDNAAGGTPGNGANSLTSTIPFSISSNLSPGSRRSTIGVGQLYESAGTISQVNIQDNAAATSIQFSSITTAIGLVGNDQSSVARFIVFNCTYEI
jgi:hypothetical protein